MYFLVKKKEKKCVRAENTNVHKSHYITLAEDSVEKKTASAWSETILCSLEMCPQSRGS